MRYEDYLTQVEVSMQDVDMLDVIETAAMKDADLTPLQRETVAGRIDRYRYTHQQVVQAAATQAAHEEIRSGDPVGVDFDIREAILP